MRKVMLLLSMLAMVALAAVPAVAQQEQNAASQYGDITQEQVQCVQNALNASNVDQDNAAVQYNQYGDNTAAQYNNAAVVQNIAQECNITINQVNQVIQAISAGGGDAAAGGGAAAGDGAAAAGEAEAGDGAAAAGEADVLPDTGGATLFTVGAGALLVAGGLLARRLIQ